MRFHEGGFHGLGALTNRELKKWFKEPLLVFMSFFQPILWLGFFGKAINLKAILVVNFGIPPDVVERTLISAFGTSDYFSFLAVGMVSFFAFLATLYSGVSLVWDRRSGFLNKVLSTPVARDIVVISKVLSASVRSVIEAFIVLVIAVLLGFRLSPDFGLVNLVGVFLVIFLMCAGLSSLFLISALRSRKWEPQVVIANLVGLPLMFASNTLLPLAALPRWLQILGEINPITYASDALRLLLLYGVNSARLVTDLMFLGIFAVACVLVSIVLSRRFITG